MAQIPHLREGPGSTKAPGRCFSNLSLEKTTVWRLHNLLWVFSSKLLLLVTWESSQPHWNPVAAVWVHHLSLFFPGTRTADSLPFWRRFYLVSYLYLTSEVVWSCLSPAPSLSPSSCSMFFKYSDQSPKEGPANSWPNSNCLCLWRKSHALISSIRLGNTDCSLGLWTATMYPCLGTSSSKTEGRIIYWHTNTDQWHETQSRQTCTLTGMLVCLNTKTLTTMLVKLQSWLCQRNKFIKPWQN